MIEVRSFSKTYIIFECQECTEEFQADVIFQIRIGTSNLKELEKFKKWRTFHQECGAAELDARIESYAPKWEEKKEFIKARIAEEMKHLDIVRSWKELEELKKNSLQKVESR